MYNVNHIVKERSNSAVKLPQVWQVRLVQPLGMETQEQQCPVVEQPAPSTQHGT